jgi:three-Cys-motif partner protein
VGRSSDRKARLSDQHALPFLASELPLTEPRRERNFKSLDCPLWTQNKARLIREYIRLFTYVTKHGAYIDGFAAPQRRNHIDLCSAKLVLENEPKRVRDFWLCDIDPKGVELLDEIKAANESKGRTIHVVPGDFNKTIDDILDSGRIGEKTATFALLDQRTFECDWSTVKKIAEHKKSMKIEIFYFFPTGWIDRSIAAISRPEAAAQAERCWGRPDWRELQGLNSVERAYMIGRRFKEELGYEWVYPYPIHEKIRRGRTMYHMIHATDHPAASPLMLRAYRKVSGDRNWNAEVTQTDLAGLWDGKEN